VRNDCGKGRRPSVLAAVDMTATFCKMWRCMTADAPVHPTLWRTCRVLANRTRLEALKRLWHEPNQTVSALAGRLNFGIPAMSQYLRALESRSLLRVRRIGRYVKYRLPPDSAEGAAAKLLSVLRRQLIKKDKSVNDVQTLVAAFTHPRRVQIIQAVHGRPQTLAQLRQATRISSRALHRHMQQLRKRNLIVRRHGTYEIAGHLEPLAAELIRLALE
jgi:DNA-binding MarR family transcriptional regulator